MKKLIQLTITYPVTIAMVVLAILLLGKISYDKLSVDLLPTLNSPRLFVEIKTVEKPAIEIEKQYIKTMESMAMRGRDVIEVSSVTRSGSTLMTVSYKWGKDMNEAFLELQKSLSGFAQQRDIKEIIVSQKDPSSEPIMVLAMSVDDDTSIADMAKMASGYIKNEIIGVDGIADVTITGTEESRVTVTTDPYKLKAYGLTVNDIATKIEDNNWKVSVGKVGEMGSQYLVTGVNLLKSIDDFGRIIVAYKSIDENAQEANNANTNATVANGDNKGKDPQNAIVYLSEVANIEVVPVISDNIVSMNGERCIGLSIYKEMQYNTLKATQDVTKTLARLEKALPGYSFKVISNQGKFIESAISEVKDSALMGVLLAIIILFLFLRRIGTTLLISLAIPISIIATFNLMYFNGLTLNVMTLGGLALGAGMLVDSAIVVIESIFRHHENGESIKDAVINGTSEVSGAITSSTLTTIVVFFPIIYIQGASGELFKDQAWSVAFSLISSLFVAILVIPMLYNKFMGKSKVKKSNIDSEKSVQINWYGRVLNSILRHRWITVMGAVVLVFGSYLLVPFIGSEFMPKNDSSALRIEMALPQGSTLSKTNQSVKSMEQLIYAFAGDSAVNVYSHVGEGSNNNSMELQGDNNAVLKVSFNEGAKINSNDLVALLSPHVASFDNVDITFSDDDNLIGSLLGSEGAPLVIEIKGEDMDRLQQITKEVYDKVQKIDGIHGVKSSITVGAPEMVVTIKREFAGINNLKIADVSSQIQNYLSGKNAGSIEYKGESCDIYVETPKVQLSEIENLMIKSGNKEYRLIEIADIYKTEAASEIYRRNQSRINRVFASYDDKFTLNTIAEQINNELDDVYLDDGYSISVTGEEEKRQESVKSLMFALILSIILVYMVMASQFESLLHPFTILLTIPLAVSGTIILFYLTDNTFNIMALIGMIMLVGIAVNNSILLVDRITQLVRDGVKLTDSILIAAQQRVRPILMTSLTTVLALLPMSFSFGEGASLRSPMAVAVIGGLVTSTVLSLVVIPCVYYILESMKRSIMSKFKK